MIQCTKCGLMKEEPSAVGSRKCQDCLNQDVRERRKANPETYRAINKRWRSKNRESHCKAKRDHYHQKGWHQKLKREYGITLEEFCCMEEEQGNKCAICGLVSEKRMCVDHDHETGTVRGLLCPACNKMIGMSKDNPSVLERAAEYLRESQNEIA